MELDDSFNFGSDKENEYTLSNSKIVHYQVELKISQNINGKQKDLNRSL